jgi:hypothetical protein
MQVAADGGQVFIGEALDQDGRNQIFWRHVRKNFLRPDVAPALFLQFHQPNDA